MSSTCKTVTAICMHPDGKYSLENIELVMKSIEGKYVQYYYLEPRSNIFDCKLCGKKSPAFSFITRRFIKNNYIFNAYYDDVHYREKNNNSKCDMATHINSDAILGTKCSCGMEHHVYNHRGYIYLLKRDSSKYTPKIRTAENILECDTCVDCTEDDIQFIKSQLEPPQNQKNFFSNFFEWLTTFF